MYISKLVFTLVVAFSVVLAGMVGYGIHYVNIDRENAELHARLTRLKHSSEKMELQLIGAGVLRAEKNEAEAIEKPPLQLPSPYDYVLARNTN
ncbi:MAG: hypothetical protein WD467_00335 [Candidatus Saccharimonadales bacterium]